VKLTRLAASVLVAGACIAGSAAAADVPDLDRGRLLYENHCIVCHTSKVHRRFPPSAIDMDALRYIVKVWVEEQKLSWTPEDIEDVVQYLDRTHYRFDK
jgi:mono/diheme cytochrome c family protein